MTKIIRPVDDKSYNLSKCFLCDGYFSKHMVTPEHIIALALGHEVYNIVLCKN